MVVGIGGGGLKPTLQFTVSDGIFYFWACFLFLPVFPPLPPSLSAPPPTPAAKLSARPPVLLPNLNKEAIWLKSDKTAGWVVGWGL